MTKVVLKARGVVKSFADGRGRRTVLNAVDLTVCAGEVVGVLGRSGCGKSTLLNVVSGLLRPDAGDVVLVDDVLDWGRPRDLAAFRRSHLGLVSQSYGLVEGESVRENVGLPVSFGPQRLGRRERNSRVAEVMTRVGLDVDPKAQVSTLSGGERQRAAIARALVRTPTILVADEPTAALDDATGTKITALLTSLASSGVGVLVATHDRAVVDICDDAFRFEGAQLLPEANHANSSELSV